MNILLQTPKMIHVLNYEWSSCVLPEDGHTCYLKHAGVIYLWYILCSKLVLILAVCYMLHRCIILSITTNLFNVANYVLCILAMFVHFVLLLFTYLTFLPVCQLQGKMTDLSYQSALMKLSLFFPCDCQKIKIL